MKRGQGQIRIHIKKNGGEKKIQAFLIVEACLEGNFVKYLPKNQIMIHHGPYKQLKQGATGGVAIILSQEFEEGWK